MECDLIVTLFVVIMRMFERGAQWVLSYAPGLQSNILDCGSKKALAIVGACSQLLVVLFIPLGKPAWFSNLEGLLSTQILLCK